MHLAETMILLRDVRRRPDLRLFFLLVWTFPVSAAWVAGSLALAQAVFEVESAQKGEGDAVASGAAAASATVSEQPANKVVPALPQREPADGPGSQTPSSLTTKPEEGPPGDAPKRPDSGGKKPDESAPGGVVQRPTEPESPPDPEELKVRPDQAGKVRVNFRNQPWPKIMEWLADISGLSLDWRELPGDYLNLVTRESYSVEEMRNLINQHLFHRGFTMIRRGEVLMVVNVEKVDPGLVPRVALEDLDRLPEFDFVRVSFALDWMLADKAAEEFKPYLSPRGKLVPLPTTNRLEAMDAVVNLRELARLLREEQSPKGQERLVREFVLQYARAEETAAQLKDLLGVKQSGFPIPPGMNPQQMQQMQQAMMAAQQQIQQMQQMQKQPGGPQEGGKRPLAFQPQTDANFVVNNRRNSIVVQAPPDKMAVIEQAVKILDVPADTGSFLAGMSRWQVYRLAAVDPEPLAKTLEELGGLDPSARIQVDKANNALIVYAPLADHVTIRAVIERLDGSGRRFEVIQLRRLPADYVAGTIDFMMGGQSETVSAAPSWLPPWERDRQKQAKKNPNEFRVDADVENNRLLLWANEIEIQEVQNLLVKLGEVPAGDAAASRVRVLEGLSPEDAANVLDTLRRQWPAVAPNPIRIEPPAGPNPSEVPDEAEPKPQPQAERPVDPRRAEAGATLPAVRAQPRDTSGTKIPASTAVLTWTEPPAESPHVSPNTGTSSAELPPLIVTQTPDGRILITCQDPRALEIVDFLLQDVVPPKSDYRIFRLRYAWADNVVKVLETLFSEKKTESRSRYSYWFDPWTSSTSEPNEPSRLSSRRAVKFVADLDTNTILVQNADARQLTQIEQIIQFYDQPPPQDSESVRVTEIFRIRYSKASKVAAAVKEVYRDLLSPDENRPGGDRGGFLLFLDGGQGDARTPRFKGLLSIGVDDLSNTLLVSSPVYLMNDIRKLIQELDQAAEPVHDAVEVITLGRGVSAESVKRALGDLFGSGGTGKDRSGDGQSSAAKKTTGGGEPQQPSSRR